MRSRRLTGRRFHRYLNPDREIEEGALQVHGLTREFLQDKPKLRDVVHELLEFVEGAEAHHAQRLVRRCVSRS